MDGENDKTDVVRTQEGITVGTWRQKYLNESLMQNPKSRPSDYASYIYDAVWTYAFALDELVRRNHWLPANLHTTAVTESVESRPRRPFQCCDFEFFSPGFSRVWRRSFFFLFFLSVSFFFCPSRHWPPSKDVVEHLENDQFHRRVGPGQLRRRSVALIGDPRRPMARQGAARDRHLSGHQQSLVGQQRHVSPWRSPQISLSLSLTPRLVFVKCRQVPTLDRSTRPIEDRQILV